MISTSSALGSCLGVVEQLHAAAVGQHQVEQDDVGLLQRHLAARVAQRSGGGDGEALVGDQHRHRFGGVGVVVDEKRVRHCVESLELSEDDACPQRLGGILGTPTASGKRANPATR